MSDDIFTRPLPKVTFEYLRKELIGEKNEDVRRGRDEVDADEQRERRKSNRDGKHVSPVAFYALSDIIIDEAQSSATMCEY
jgi:hypothetical protein